MTDKMSVYEFGRELLRTQDLDPLYVALYGGFRGGVIDESQLKRWLFAYWCFYHAGFASYASERTGDAFWAVMERAAVNVIEAPGGGRWPRGTERRHFRGQKAIDAVRRFASGGDPEHYVDILREASFLRDVLAILSPWPMFGPWIGYKVADMVDACLGWRIIFPKDVASLYREPAEGLRIIARAEGTDEKIAYRRLLAHFSTESAPPRHECFCGPAEVETILCKYKAHLGGHYPVGKDTREIGAAFADCWGDTARALKSRMPALTGVG